MLKYGRAYVKQAMQEYENKLRAQLERSLRRKAAALGFELVPQAATPQTGGMSSGHGPAAGFRRWQLQQQHFPTQSAGKRGTCGLCQKE
jgi:hypothetical protein